MSHARRRRTHAPSPRVQFRCVRDRAASKPARIRYGLGGLSHASKLSEAPKPESIGSRPEPIRYRLGYCVCRRIEPPRGHHVLASPNSRQRALCVESPPGEHLDRRDPRPPHHGHTPGFLPRGRPCPVFRGPLQSGKLRSFEQVVRVRRRSMMRLMASLTKAATVPRIVQNRTSIDDCG
jgi:hypothetical protein